MRKNQTMALLCLLFLGLATGSPVARPTSKFEIGRVVGGSDASLTDFPYLVSIEDITFNRFHYCSGTLYSSTCTVTSGFCMHGEDVNDPKNMQVVTGEFDLNWHEQSEQIRPVYMLFIYGAYQANSRENDIAIIRFQEPVILNEFVYPIPLPTLYTNFTGSCIVVGWGRTGEDQPESKTIKQVTVPIISDEDCQKAYGYRQVFDTNMCTGAPEGGVAPCYGDAGSPLACRNATGLWFAGIVSWSYGCGRPEYPQVYTEVSYFSKWIERFGNN